MSTICIIDDDPIHQRIAQILIEKNQLYDKAITFSDADKALEYLSLNSSINENLPDVILLDLNMPCIDGWDFLDVFIPMYERFTKDIKVYIVTSSVDEKDKLRSQTFPCVKGFISKPLSSEVIRSTSI